MQEENIKNKNNQPINKYKNSFNKKEKPYNNHN